MVGPGDCTPDPKVEVKLADYGISRLSLPTGAKGFGGTEGYIIKCNFGHFHCNSKHF
jgi:hypothetical protein